MPLALLAGATVGLGAWLAVIALRGVEATAGSARWRAPGWLRARTDLPAARAALALALGAVVGIVTRWPVMVALALLAGFCSVDLLSARRRRQDRAGRSEAVAEWVEQLRDVMAAGKGLETAIGATAEFAPAPIRGQVVEMQRAVTERRVPLHRALERFGWRVANPTCDLAVAALAMVARQEGERLGGVLDALAATARDDAAWQRRVETGRSRTRAEVRIIIATMLLVPVIVSLVDRTFLSPYDTALGQVVMAAIAACYIGGIAWLARLGRGPDEPRLLAVEVEA